MNKNGTTFIINLIKLPNGYTFQSVTEGGNIGNKKKNIAKEKGKNNTTKQIHRIFRELALDPQQPQELLNPIIEEPEPIYKPLEPQIEEEYSIQVKRENGLPESPATWYDETSIHVIQKESLPQFFDGKSYKTPAIYQKYRNFIVNLYRKNPAQYLTKIACRRILRGDVSTIMKIHSFLEKEGVINFCVSKQGNYTFNTSMFSRVINEQSKYGIAFDKYTDTDQQKTVDPVDMTNITVTTVNKCFSKSNRVFCLKCNIICGILWYKKKEDMENNSVLCLECFQNLSETEAEEYAKVDIIKKIDSGQTDTKAVWSIEDNLKLLNFTSKPEDNWGKLENSFEKKKTMVDIALQFMQFPIGNFDPIAEKPVQPAIQDKAEDHINKLMKRFKQSEYSNPSKIESQLQNLTNQIFTKNTLQITNKLCKKFQTKIHTNFQIEKMIQSTLFQLNNLRTLSKKNIQNQVPFINEKKTQNESQYNQNQSSNQRDDEQEQQQYHDQDQPQNVKDGEFQDFINNLSYN